jgi:hydrogenase maturation factor
VVGSLSGVCYSCLGEERGMGRWVLVHFAVLYSYLCDFFIN